MRKQVVIINGSGGVGKDTFIDTLSKTCFSENDVWNYSSIDKIKEIAKTIGWDGKKDEAGRRFLAGLKHVCDEYNNLSFEMMREKYSEFQKSSASILFLHIREPYNIEIAKKAFSAVTVLVKRDSVEHITSNEADMNVENYYYDYVVHNDSDIEDLKDECHKFIYYLNSIID